MYVPDSEMQGRSISEREHRNTTIGKKNVALAPVGAYDEDVIDLS